MELCYPFLILTSVIATAFAEKGQLCLTPDNKNGTCIDVQECESLLNLISSKNNSDIDFAKKSQCGYDTKPLACCKIDESTPTTQQKNLLPNLDECGFMLDSIIVGGEVTNLDEYPWTAAIEYKTKATDENVGIQCVGVLINRRFILTTASCLTDQELTIANIRLGEWNLVTDPDCVTTSYGEECADPVQIFNPVKTIPHPAYNKNDRSNDIGLIQIEGVVKYTDFVRPICLAPAGTPPLIARSTVTAVGWDNKKDGSEMKLLQVRLSTHSQEECRRMPLIKSSSLENIQCGIGQSGSCSVNVGSPLMRKFENKNRNRNWHVEGIAIFGTKIGTSDCFVIYTNILNHISWILDILAQE